MWKLITDLPIKSRNEAIEKLNWYSMRWKIETFHKILKSGCKAEETKLRSAKRISNLISVYCILGWRIFWLTMINRISTKMTPRIALTKMEIYLLDKLVKNSGIKIRRNRLSNYTLKIAKLGGYLALVGDSPPGNIVMWRGLSRLTDIELGFNLAVTIVGN